MPAAGDVLTSEPSDYGAQIKQYRLAEGLSVPRLAERAGLHPNALRKIEDGRTAVPQTATRRQLGQALGLSEQQREHLERLVKRPSASGRQPLFPFIGRQEELELLRRHLDASETPMLVLCGEPGIGKTSLLTQAATLGITRGMRVLWGSCSRWSVQQNPYSPLVDTLEACLERPHARVQRDLVGCEWLSLLLPQLLDAPFKLPRCHAPEGQERWLISQAILRFLLQSAGRRGTLLLLDDLHWAGSDALALLVDLFRAAPTDGLRCIAAYRESEVSPGEAFSNAVADLVSSGLVERLTLGPLSDAEAHDLLDTLLGDIGTITLPVRRQILQRGDGVPFFLVSCGLSLRDDVQHGRVHDQLPWSVAQSVGQRIAALSSPAQEILQAVALTGNAHRSLLSALFHAPRGELVAPLEEAQRAHLLKEVDAHSYSVEHDVIREAIEADLSTARRAALHLKIAEALEQGRPDVLRARAAEVGLHFLHADAPARALPYFLRGGDEAEALFAHHDAEQHYLQALSLAQHLSSRQMESEAWERLGKVWTFTARYDRAMDALERAVQLDREEGNTDAEARAIVQLARVHVLSGAPHEGRMRAEQMIARLGQSASPRSLASLHAARTQCLQTEGEYARELEAAEAAAKYASQIHDEALLAETRARHGIALQMLNRLPEARRMLHAAIPRLERTGSLDMLSVALRELGWICLCMADFDQGRQYRKRAVEVAETLQDPARIAVELANLAFVDIVGGRWSEANSAVQRALAIVRSLGTPPSTIYPLFVKGALELLRGVDWAEADAYLDECGAVALQAGDLAMAWQVQWALAERDLFIGDAEQALARFTRFGGIKRYQEMNATHAPFLVRVFASLNAAVGQIEDAEGLIQMAIRGSEDAEDRLHLVEAYRVYGQIKALQGNLDDAEDLLTRSHNFAKQTRYPFGEGRAIHGLGLVCAAQGNLPDARRYLTRASAIFVHLGAAKNWERTEECLRQLEKSACRNATWFERF